MMNEKALTIRQDDSDLAAKRIILMRLEREYRRFLAAATSVDEHGYHERWLDGRLGVAEIVALHAGWLEKLDEGLRLARDGAPLEQIDWLAVDRWEGILYARGSGQHKAHLLRALKRAFQSFLNSASGLPARQYGRSGLLARMLSYVGVCKFGLHASLIDAWSKGRLDRAAQPNGIKRGLAA
jgi:hypothetical protein